MSSARLGYARLLGPAAVVRFVPDPGFSGRLTNGFRFAEGLPLFQSRMRCLPEAAPGLKALLVEVFTNEGSGTMIQAAPPVAAGVAP